MFTNSIFGLVTENHGSEGCLIISYSLTIYTDIYLLSKSYEAEFNDFLSC